jgi:hypothetical protein
MARSDGAPPSTGGSDTARRVFLQRGVALAVASGISAWTAAAPGGDRSRVVIVGAGLAGLCAAHALRQAGIRATVYEGSPRVGARCWTESRAFAAGQIAERGGELIDTPHVAIRALATQFGLELDFGRLLANAYTEELGGDPGEISAITVVSLLAASPRDRFSPYEESDQRFHIRGGNGQLSDRLAQSVEGQVARSRAPPASSIASRAAPSRKPPARAKSMRARSTRCATSSACIPAPQTRGTAA